VSKEMKIEKREMILKEEDKTTRTGEKRKRNLGDKRN
jgi:hypothetical protein